MKNAERKEVKINTILDNCKFYIKKPIPIKAVQINEPFEVTTLEGIFHAKAGDYLIEGVKGEFYSCDKEIFESSYEEIPPIKSIL